MSLITLRRDRRRTVSKHRVQQYVHKKLMQLWRESVRAFINEAIKHVSVDTGMSEASFYNLASEVRRSGLTAFGGNIVMSDIMSKGPKAPHAAYVDMSGKVHPGVKKSIPFGKQLSPKGKAFRLLFGSPNNPKMLFEFNIVIYQYWFHESVWNSLENGRIAFLAYWKANFSRFIKTRDILEFILKGD